MTDKEIVPVVEKVITEQEKTRALQSAIYYLTKQQPFYGSLLGELTVKYTDMVPTAGITYNVKLQQYEIYINANFFCNLTNDERVGVFHHEVLHFTNKHLFRLPFTDKAVKDEDKRLFNVAGDMSINQYIQVLPKGCVDVKEWKLDDGNAFPTLQNMECYHELIKEESKKQKESEDNKKEGKGKGTKGNVNEKLENFKDFDQHFWDSLDEETKKKMLEEAKKVLKRTIEKTSYGFTNVPDSIKDLLQEIETMAAGINYKEILRSTIKKTVSCSDRESTWKKPNKRYGAYSPGTKVGALPKLSIYADSSGSISVTELNNFLSIICEFLKVGVRQCDLGLWHTELYYKKKYKLNTELNREEVQSGGTDVTSVLEDIKKCKPDLALVLTDGYFDMPDIKYAGEILWIISVGGNKNHNFPKSQKVIFLENLK